MKSAKTQPKSKMRPTSGSKAMTGAKRSQPIPIAKRKIIPPPMANENKAAQAGVMEAEQAPLDFARQIGSMMPWPFSYPEAFLTNSNINLILQKIKQTEQASNNIMELMLGFFANLRKIWQKHD